jgi:plastocyanin
MSIYKIQIKPGKPAVFDPNPLTVYANDSVFWFNGDPNNAHWPAPSAANPTGFLAYQIPPNTPSSQVSFGSTQTIPYVCINHPGESGKIIVEPGKKAAFGGKTKKGAFGGKTKKGAFGTTTRY